MKGQQLYDHFRRNLEDEVAPFLFSETEVVTYMWLAYVAFVRGIGGIPDSRSSICTIPIVDGQREYQISAAITRYRVAYLESTGKHLEINDGIDEVKRTGEIDGYITTTKGSPRHLLVGNDNGFVELYPIPNANDVLKLQVYRQPLTVPEIGTYADFEFSDLRDEDFQGLFYHMAYQAYQRQDAETFDMQKSNNYLGLYNQAVEEHINVLQRKKRSLHMMQYNGL